MEKISGKWVGTTVNDIGEKSEAFLDVTEHADGTLTGTWHVKGMKIEKGERVTPALLQWEGTPDGGRSGYYRVRCLQKGKSLILDWTWSGKEDGKVRGGVGTTILIRK